jgi:hypothetical protein
MLFDRCPYLAETAVADAPPARGGLFLLGILLLQQRQRRPPQTRPRPSSGGCGGAGAQLLLMVLQGLTVGQDSEVGHSMQVSAAAGSTVVCR